MFRKYGLAVLKLSLLTAGFALFSPGVYATALFFDDFNGTSLQSNYWGQTGVGTITVANGSARFIATSSTSAVGASTKGKFTVSGGNIVVESGFAGTGSSRDTTIRLVDSSDESSYIQLSDTSYFGWGLNLQGIGAYEFVEKSPVSGSTSLSSINNGISVSTLKQYRLTVSGNSVTLERGDTLTNLTEKLTRTLSTSIAGKTFYLAISTGGSSYTDSSFDYVRVDTPGTCDTTTPYNQGYAAAQAACKANPSSCGITVGTSGTGVTTGSHATYNPTANTVHIPYLDVSLLGTTSVYEVDLTVMPNTNPLQLKLQNAKQVQ